MSKISIIGAGNVGATAAQFIAMKGSVDEIVLVDVKENYAEGKAMDISQSLLILGSKTEVSGHTNNYEPTKDSDIVVVTSGTPRRPGMTREELVNVNSKIVKSVLSEVYKYSPNAIYIIVSNPMDTMTYLAVKYLKSLGKENTETTVFGMGGVLDTARFHYYQTTVCHKEKDNVEGFVVGGHGDTTMIPIIDDPKDASGWEDLEIASEKTKKGGATLTSMLGTSAWLAPAAAICETAMDVLNNFTFGESTQSVYREEYDACIGSLVSLGRSGINTITAGEWENGEAFKASLEAVKKVNENLKGLI